MLRGEGAAVYVYLPSQLHQGRRMPEAREGIQAAGGQGHRRAVELMTSQRDCPGGSVAVDILMPWLQLLEMSEVASVSTPNVIARCSYFCFCARSVYAICTGMTLTSGF